MTTQVAHRKSPIANGVLNQDRSRVKALDALRQGKSITAAAEAAGVSRITLWQWRQKDSAFEEAVKDAAEAGADRLEDEASRRALGWTEDVYDANGKVVGARFKYSDRMMELRLGAARPDKYRRGDSLNIINNVDARTLNATISPEAAKLLEAVALNKQGGFDRGKGE